MIIIWLISDENFFAGVAIWFIGAITGWRKVNDLIHHHTYDWVASFPGVERAA